MKEVVSVRGKTISEITFLLGCEHMIKRITIVLYIGIACMTAVFVILFLLYAKFRVKYCEFGGDDEEIKSEFETEFCSYKKRCEKKGISSLSEPEYYILQKKRKKAMDIGLNVLYAVVAMVTIALLVISLTAVSYNAQGKQFYLGNKAYFVVQTSSMSYKEEKNPYFDYLPDNQIEQFSLISVEKDREIELYDVIAYNYNDTVYVHRVVRIYEKEGVIYYTAMGDTNNVSFSYEKALTEQDILGVYTGYKNLALGHALAFLRSGVGLFAVALATAFLVFYDMARIKIERSYNERVELVVERIIEKQNPSTEVKPEESFQNLYSPPVQVVTKEYVFDPFERCRVSGGRRGKVELKVPPKEKAKKRKKGLRFGKSEIRVPTFAEQAKKRKRKSLKSYVDKDISGDVQ